MRISVPQDRWRLAAASVALGIALLTTATVDWHPVGPPADVVRAQAETRVTPVAAEPDPSTAAAAPLPAPVAARPQPAKHTVAAASYPCAGTTKSGRQCKRMIRSGKYCYQHANQGD